MQLKEMMDEICSRWSLPKDYIEFLLKSLLLTRQCALAHIFYTQNTLP